VNRDWPEPPEKLRDRDIWLPWRYEEREGKDGEIYQTKVPVDPTGGGRGDSTDPSKRTDFESAVRFANNHSDVAGIGFAFPEDDTLAGVDLDDVRDPDDGQLLPWAREIVSDLDSYTEISPSGTGVHVVVVGFKPGDKSRKTVDEDGETDADGGCEVEIYDDSRFFTYTGDVLEGLDRAFDTVKQRHSELGQLYDDYLGPDGPDQERDGVDDEATASPQGGTSRRNDLSDEEVLETARNAKHGVKFERLERGDDSLHSDDTSRADMAFVSYLAFYTGGDRTQIERLFKSSGRMRPKVRDRDDYLERTIDAALEHQQEFYQGPRSDDAPSTTAVDEAIDAIEDDLEGDEQDDHDDVQEETSWTSLASTPSSRAPVQEDILYRVLEPFNDEDDPIDSATAVNRVADIFDDAWHFIYPERQVPGWRETLYVYNPTTGVYEPRGEAFASSQAEELLGAFATNQRVNEIVEKLSRRNIERGPAFDVSPHRLVVGNGILDLHTGELCDHTPEEYHATRVGVDYHEDAECPEIDEFFHEIVEDQDAATLYRVAAHTLYKDYIGAKAVMLVGGGSNGKTMFTWLLEELLNPTDTERNTTGISLGEISQGDFALSNLYGKMANINADINSSDVSDLGPLKRLTGGDLMDADVKYESRVRFRNYASLIFAVNQMPSFSEDTHALWRRWVYLKFPYTFEPGEPETDPEHVLKERIGNEEELEGLLAKCVREIQTWHDGREMFPDIPSPDQIREMMLRASEPVYDFAKVCLKEDQESEIPKDEVRQAFREYANQTSLGSDIAMNPNVFGEKLISVADWPIETSRPTKGNRRVRCYKGIDWTERGRQVLEGNEPDERGQTGLTANGPSHTGRVSDQGTVGWDFDEIPDDATGPAADAKRLYRILLKSTSNSMAKGELFSAAADRHDLDPRRAETALDKLRSRGDVTVDDGEIVPK